MSAKDGIFAGFIKTATGEQPEPEGHVKQSELPDDEPYVLPPIRPDNYTAFRLGKRRERLLIAPATQPFQFPFYHELTDISFDQEYQLGFILFFHAMTVEVLGQNLWPVAHAITSSRCDAIYEYHEKHWPDFSGKTGEPFIKSITIGPPVKLVADENADLERENADPTS